MTARGGQDQAGRPAAKLPCLASLAVAAALIPAAAIAAPVAGDDPAAAELYVDRLINDGKLEQITVQEEAPTLERKGNLRSLVVELSGSITAPRARVDGVAANSLDQTQREAGIAITGRYQTDNLGTLGLDAQLRFGSSPGLLGAAATEHWSGSVTASTRGLPLGDGWLADSAVGAATMPVSELARRQSRFFLPNLPIMGANLVVRGFAPLTREQSGIEPEATTSFNVAVGEPGLFGGVRLSDFTGLGGLAVSGGAQTVLSPQWSAAVQALAVRDTRDPYAAILLDPAQIPANAQVSAEGAYATLAYSSGALRVQANGIWSHRSGGSASPIFPAGHAGGGWVDARLRAGRTSHSAGLYYFGPGLSWGTSALINNARGGYYRFASSSQRWRWTVNLDAVDAVRPGGASGIIANAEVRRRLNFSTWAGFSSTVRRTARQTSGQVLGFLDFTTRLGETRAELGWAQDRETSLYRVGLNQHWELPDWLPSGSRLSTQLSYQHSVQSVAAGLLPSSPERERSDSFAVGLSAGATPFSGISFDATLAYNSDARLTTASALGPIDTGSGALGLLSTQQGQAFSATLVASARLSSQWSLSASYTDTRSQLTARYGLSDPSASLLGLLPGESVAGQRSSFRLRAGFLTLRFTGSGGRGRGSLGIRTYPVGGTGNLEGRIYLDANDNGRHEAAEAGAANVLVILDGIQAVRTDETGYYRFEGIADGPHQISLNTDALPLPWMIEAEGKRGSGEAYARAISIGVRETMRLDIAAHRD